MRVRLVLLLAAATAAIALVAAGCGGDGDSGSDPAALAPVETPVFVEVAVRPEGTLQENIDSLASKVAGIDDLGALIVSELEESALASGEEFDFDKEVAPWLGENAGIFLQEYDGEEFLGYGIAVQCTDTDAAQELIDKQSEGEAPKDVSYEGTDFKVDPEDGEAVGIIGDFLAFAEDEETFKQMVDAADGESLADQDAYADTVDAAAAESFADVFVDIGALIEESGGTIDPEAQGFLETAGIEPKEATAIASLVPGANVLEIDFATNAGGENVTSGDASELLGSLPGGSLAAFAAPEVGKSLGEAIGSLDENGIPGELPPNRLKSTMKAAGIDLDRITGGIGDVALFAQGNTESNLTGALVIDASDAEEASNTVANIGLLLRATETPGVTALSGAATGFTIRSPELGGQPLVVAATGDKIAISYGPAASAQVLSAGDGSTLASNPQYEAAVAALDGTPISGFVSGPATLALLENVISPEVLEDFETVRPALEKAEYLAIGAGSSGDLTTAKLIVGFTK